MEDLPQVFTLSQNWPNPIILSTNIYYELESLNYIELKIYNSLGKIVKTLDKGVKTIGPHSVQWNRQDEYGNLVANGFYWVRMRVGGEVIQKKMLVLK